MMINKARTHYWSLSEFTWLPLKQGIRDQIAASTLKAKRGSSDIDQAAKQIRQKP